MKGRHSIEMSGVRAFPHDLLQGLSMRSSVAGFAACRRQQQQIFHPFAGWFSASRRCNRGVSNRDWEGLPVMLDVSPLTGTALQRRDPPDRRLQWRV
jgi:hypothetical protein